MTTYAVRPLVPDTPDDLIAQLYRTEGKAEIIEGRIVEFMPTGGMPGYAAAEIVFSLKLHLKATGTVGTVVGDNVGFVVNLPNRRSFSPDAAYFVGAKLTMKFATGAPQFAVEVRSENDYGPAMEREITQKRADYFAAGTLVVWDVDLLASDVIRSYTAPNPDVPIVFVRGGIAHAEPVVPGWTMPVDTLFE